MNNQYWLNIAIQAAKENPIEKLPKMAALLVMNSYNEMYLGRNQHKTHPLQAKFGRNPQSIFLHAEIDVLVRALIKQNIRIAILNGNYYDKLPNSSIFVARVSKNGIPMLAKPCSGCMGALLHFGIIDIHWTK